MEKTINILGRPFSITDRDESAYLTGVSKDFEADTLATFTAVCAPRFNVLDIGANIGLTAIALGSVCSKGKVFAIEASPETFKYLQQNIAGCRLGNIVCENMAASSAPGELMLSHPRHFSAGGFISQKYRVVGHDHLRYSVHACPVDDYLDKIGVKRIDFIKIDVEGFELEVLRGARRTIERSKPIIYCEVNHWCLNVLQRVCLPDFIEEIFTFCPHVFAINSDLHYLDLSEHAALHKFYHDHTTKFHFLNLLCGFDKEALIAKLASLAFSDESAAKCHARRSASDAFVNSGSWRHAAPLRPLRVLKRYLVGPRVK